MLLNKKIFKTVFILVSLFFISSISVFASKGEYSESGLVIDHENILTEEEKKELNQRLLDFEQNTGIEIAVVTVDDLGGKSIEEFANELFNQLGIGRQGKIMAY
jgi:uncharacterized protein